MTRNLLLFLRYLPLCAPLAIAAACSTASSLPDVDRVFLSAAGNWDRNRDGIVTCDEWRAYASELFDSADTNHDGFVDATEYPKIVGTDRMFQTVDLRYYDADHDGKLSRTEFVDKPNRAFALLDQSNQCKLNADQVAGARAHTEQVFDNKKPESGDPREKSIPGVKQ
jgi:Ca2+-binding EF-hand superfamily protein